jgi:hypothetical protein
MGVMLHAQRAHPGKPPFGTGQDAIMNHGLYTRGNLFEGNDADGKIITADHWWGPNGPRTTAFRNRIVGSQYRQSIISNDKEKGGSWITGDRINWIGNTAAYYMTMTAPVSSADAMQSVHDFDGEDHSQSVRTTNMWVEKNMFRATNTCSGDPSLNRCGFHQDTPNSDTSCGTAVGDCRSKFGPNGALGSNYGGSRPSSDHTNDSGTPHSLYRPATPPPIWWCEEACDWVHVHNGIGAWGDDFGAQLCKLPAQLLAEGRACTPVNCEGDNCTAPVPAPRVSRPDFMR